MIYLNDRDGGAFRGGDTVFYALHSAPSGSGSGSGSVDSAEHGLFLSAEDEAAALSVAITPKKGRMVVFNHDVWHRGDVVIADGQIESGGHGQIEKEGAFKFILRSDVMFECFDRETFDRGRLMADPLYLQSQRLYRRTVSLQNEGAVRESTVSYLKALSIQTLLPSVVVDVDYGDEHERVSADVYFSIFSFLDVYRLATVCRVSRSWNFHGSAPTLWRNAYGRHFDLVHQHRLSSDDPSYDALFRPWKYLFSYRFMVRNQFPVIALNLWLNAVEIASTSKRKQSQPQPPPPRHWTHDQRLLEGEQAQYIPLAVSQYVETNMWSWKPYRKETLYGKAIFAAIGSGPQWIVGRDATLCGLSFHKLLKQILYFPNAVLSLPSVLDDNALFILYLKYMMTRFDAEKLFCLNLRNTEEEVARHRALKHAVVVLAEHRMFSVAVIENGKRLRRKELMRKFVASASMNKKTDDGDGDGDGDDEQKEDDLNLFPRGFFHFRDDYDDEFYVTNISNFDLIGSVDTESSICKLAATASDQDQQKEAQPPIDRMARYGGWGRSLKLVNESTTAPLPVVVDQDDEKVDVDKALPYYVDLETLGDDELLERMKKRLSAADYAAMTTVDCGSEVMAGLVNDIFVGPNEGKDIPQNDDFQDLLDRRYRNRSGPESRGHEYYQRVGAPLCDSLCFSPWHLVSALDEVLRECHRIKLFDGVVADDGGDTEDDDEEKMNAVPIVVVGPLTNHYGRFVAEFVECCNDEERFKGMRTKMEAEYVRNDGSRKVEDRSSAIQHLVSSVLTPQIMREFRNMADVKRDIMEPFAKMTEHVEAVEPN